MYHVQAWGKSKYTLLQFYVLINPSINLSINCVVLNNFYKQSMTNNNNKQHRFQYVVIIMTMSGVTGMMLWSVNRSNHSCFLFCVCQ